MSCKARHPRFGDFMDKSIDIEISTILDNLNNIRQLAVD